MYEDLLLCVLDYSLVKNVYNFKYINKSFHSTFNFHLKKKLAKKINQKMKLPDNHSFGQGLLEVIINNKNLKLHGILFELLNDENLNTKIQIHCKKVDFEQKSKDEENLLQYLNNHFNQGESFFNRGNRVYIRYPEIFVSLSNNINKEIDETTFDKSYFSGKKICITSPEDIFTKVCKIDDIPKGKIDELLLTAEKYYNLNYTVLIHKKIFIEQLNIFSIRELEDCLIYIRCNDSPIKLFKYDQDKNYLYYNKYSKNTPDEDYEFSNEFEYYDGYYDT